MHPHSHSQSNGTIAFDEALTDVARIYRSITGRELPRNRSDHPIIPTPPERDPQRVAEVVLEQLASLLERHLQAGNALPSLVPMVDCWESAGELVIAMDLPGLDRSSLRAEIRDGMLIVWGQRETSHPEGARPVAIERQPGRFERQVMLPRGITAEPLEAELREGVLRLRLARKEGILANQVIEVR